MKVKSIHIINALKSKGLPTTGGTYTLRGQSSARRSGLSVKQVYAGISQPPKEFKVDWRLSRWDNSDTNTARHLSNAKKHLSSLGFKVRKEEGALFVKATRTQAQKEASKKNIKVAQKASRHMAFHSAATRHKGAK